MRQKNLIQATISIFLFLPGTLWTTFQPEATSINQLSPAIIQIAESQVYYVDSNHPQANDSNPGSEALPWLTIQHAADAANPGDLIYVKEGQYDERVVVKNSGTSEAMITFKALPRRGILMQGFYINNADHVWIEGFRITNLLTGWDERFGIFINGNHIEIIDNELFELKATAIQGIWGDHNSTAVHIADNYIYHSQMGIGISGADWVVENNEIKRLYGYGTMGDSDYMRFFGDNHIIRGNFFHGTHFDEIGSAHVDCFQTFDNNGEHGHNILVDGNTCFDFHQGFMGEAHYYHNISHITFRNNIFAHGRAWGLNVHDIPYITVENNTFFDIRHHGTGFRGDSHHNLVINNIYYNTGTSYWASDGASLNGDYNLIFESRDPTIPGQHDLIGVDPILVDPNGDDYHLQSTSPAIDTGDQLPEVTTDLEGTSRPQGNGFDIGAYEFIQTGPSPTFVDVPFSHPYHDEIEVLYQEGYVAGCNLDPLMYCPDDAMNRAESAVFVERGIHTAEYMPTQPTTQVFADVALDQWYAKWANGLWDDEYTAGCGVDPLIYCPLLGHTRAEGCVFYLRMMHGVDYLPPDPTGIFVDAPVTEWYTKWVEAAYNAGLIEPCQTSPEMRFCPNDPLSRGLGAYMMVKAKGLALP